MIKNKKKKTKKNLFTFPILLLLIGALIVRLALSPYGTLMLDHNTFIGWSNRLVEMGLSRFYDGWSDYLPGYLYILWILGWIKKLVIVPSVVLYKLPAIFSDVLTGLLIYKIVKKLKNQKWAMIVSGLYLFNPAILANSTLWGQADSLTASFSLLALWLIDMNPFLSAFALAFGTLVKPQAALAAPVILFVMLKNKWSLEKILRYVLISFLLFTVAFIPFAGSNNLSFFIYERISTTLGQYPYTSINAFNLWGLWGFWQEGSMFTSLFSILLPIGFFLLTTFKLWKTKNARYLLLSLAFAVNFLFSTRMHERHLLPVFAPLAISASIYESLWLTYAGLSLIYVVNLYYAFVWISQNFVSVLSFPAIVFCIIMNLALFGWMFFVITNQSKKKIFDPLSLFRKNFKKLFKKSKKGKRRLSNKTIKSALLIVVVFALLSRLLWLGSPKNEYFDEVYHAFTARRMLHGDPKAWEWWNTSPEGFAYEWTHPPMAKLGMVLGMLVFGENAFGWRLPGALLGVGSVLLVYFIAKELFEDKLIGLLSAGAFALEGLPLTISRIGMNDSYLLFFSLFTLYLFIVDKYLLAAIAYGLAISSKWSAVWLAPVLLVSFFVLKKKFKLKYLLYALIPPLIYITSYLPMFFTGHGFDIFIGVQKQMWWYHTRLEATHAYTSSWWSWPLMIRPVYVYTSNMISNSVARIYVMGNPIILWLGIVAIVLSAISAYLEKNKKIGLIVFSYFVLFAGWATSPRIMFFYHYLPSVPFLAIAIGYMLKKYPKTIAPLLTVALASFLFFFPHLTGLNIPVWLDKLYYWLPSWR